MNPNKALKKKGTHMEQQWFIRFTVWYKNNKDEHVEIRGNAAFSLNSASFLPGTILNSLKSFYKKHLEEAGKIYPNSPIEAVIDHSMKIDRAGVLDFNQEHGLSEGELLFIRSREFIDRMAVAFTKPS